jgi:hypothetical protein
MDTIAHDGCCVIAQIVVEKAMAKGNEVPRLAA